MKKTLLLLALLVAACGPTPVAPTPVVIVQTVVVQPTAVPTTAPEDGPTLANIGWAPNQIVDDYYTKEIGPGVGYALLDPEMYLMLFDDTSIGIQFQATGISEAENNVVIVTLLASGVPETVVRTLVIELISRTGRVAELNGWKYAVGLETGLVTVMVFPPGYH